MSESQAGMSYRKIAESAYKAWSAKLGRRKGAVVFRSFPKWEDLSSHTQDAWEAAIRQAELCFSQASVFPMTGHDLDESSWADWESPFREEK